MKITKRIRKEYKTHLIKSTLFWTLAMVLFAIFRYYAIGYEVGIHIHEAYSSIYSMGQILFGFGAVGFVIGLVYGTVEYFFDNHFSRRIPIGLNILLQILLVFISFVGISDVAIRISYRMNNFHFPMELGWWYRDRTFWPVLLYLPLASFVFSLIVIVSEKFGKGIFLKFLIGKYKVPKEEQRIFMFIDLKSSTAIAEHLGHLKYSQLIQDCFYDLNEIVSDYDAEIYQYVGDEVVMSWRYKRGLLNRNCVDLFFAFQQKLWSKERLYHERFGLVPEFKAGVHGGNVMVSEVGVLKKELAYHGDVVNTTSRIQGACNDFNCALLISERLLQELQAHNHVTSLFLGSVMLKGKEKEISIHTVSPFQTDQPVP